MPNELINEPCGSPAYIAPEIVAGEDYSPFKTDIWSAGICLYSILYNKVPFVSQTNTNL